MKTTRYGESLIVVSERTLAFAVTVELGISNMEENRASHKENILEVKLIMKLLINIQINSTHVSSPHIYPKLPDTL